MKTFYIKTSHLSPDFSSDLNVDLYRAEKWVRNEDGEPVRVADGFLLETEFGTSFYTSRVKAYIDYWRAREKAQRRNVGTIGAVPIERSRSPVGRKQGGGASRGGGAAPRQ